MRYESIDKDNIKLYAGMIPVETEPLIFHKKTHAYAAVFAESPVGAAVWSESDKDGYGRLLSLFVLPEARRMGIGSFLLETVMGKMIELGMEGIVCRYSDSGDRALLTPFFNELGIETNVASVPLGRVSLLEAAKAVRNIPGAGKETGISSAKLTGREKNSVCRWIEELSGEDPIEYLNGNSESFFVLEGDSVKSALLFRREDEETLSLDYALSSDPKTLIGLLSHALRVYAGHYPKETRIDMLLATESGFGLYKKLFGDTDLVARVAECRQNFSFV